MQSKLPDLNAYWRDYHKQGKSALDNHDYDTCISCVYSMLALMPDEYRLEVNTDKYNELVRLRSIVVCSECKKENNYDDVEIDDRLVPFDISILLGSKTEKVWICIFCKFENEFTSTKLEKEIRKEPAYFEVIAKPLPTPRGLEGRTFFHSKMVSWWNNAVIEIDHQLALLRTNYDPDGEDPDTEDGGEE